MKISLLKLLFNFPAPILLALMLNEMRPGPIKKAAQTISYLPHFISWIIVAGILSSLLSPSTGTINYIIKALGGQPILFLTDTKWFRPILIISGIWKEIGWGSVVYLAALCSIPAEQYESAKIDGANRFQRLYYITIPSMKGIVSIMLLMQAGNIMNAGFDQVFNLYSTSVYEVGDIIDTYVYRVGIGQMMYSFNTAVGLFKSVVNFALVLAVNMVTKKLNDGESVLY
ncbi:MAG: ABC transporter permease [Eisenbergiella sp.]